MDIQEIINGRIGVGLAYGLGRVIPPGLGKNLAAWLGQMIAARKELTMVRAVRANQWVVSGESMHGQELDLAVAQTFVNTAYSNYQFYRALKKPQSMSDLVEFSEKLQEILAERQQQKRGLIITGVHLGNFDLVMQAAARMLRQQSGGIRALAISAPQPGKGYEWQNKIRREGGVEIVPASLSAIKLAVQWLDEGNIVISGLDRPVPEARYKPNFFGRRAALPVIHISLALRTSTPIIVTGAISRPDGIYQIIVSDLLYMNSFPDRYQEITRNAEMVLEVAAGCIRRSPQQWAMFYPVWPDALVDIPAT